MLLGRENKRDFDHIINVLDVLDHKTDGRYRHSIDRIKEILQELDKDLSEEVDLRSTLEKFRSKGFKVSKYLTTSFSDHNSMFKKLHKLCDELKELDKIVMAYNNLKRELKETETAKRLESIMYDPEKIMEAKSLWHKLNK